MHEDLSIKLAAMSLGWGNPSGEDLVPFLKEVKAAGYDGVAGFADAGWDDYIDQPAKFSRLLANEGLSLASLDAKTHGDLDQYRRICSFMAELRCRHLVCLGGVGTVVENYVALGPVLERIGETALEFGVRVVYHNGRTRESFSDMETVLSNSDPGKVFAMCDTGHATRDFVELPRAERAVRFMEKYWERLDFIEFKDWHPETDLNTPVGEGLCGWEAVFALIKEKRYSDWITIEQNGLSRGHSAVECARISRQFIHEGLGV
ncbi:sugar phosphate isomerase/epimerase family protein [Candidatus Poribacteria bacterium]